MNIKQGVDLTGIMRREGIINIHMDPSGYFQLRMRGDILGTGKTVGEAYQCALADRNAQAVRVAA